MSGMEVLAAMGALRIWLCVMVYVIGWFAAAVAIGRSDARSKKSGQIDGGEAFEVAFWALFWPVGAPILLIQWAVNRPGKRASSIVELQRLIAEGERENGIAP